MAMESSNPSSAASVHLPVMADEVLHGLQLSPGMTVVDGTFGGGGHARMIAERIAPDGRLLAIDRDAGAGIRFMESAIPGHFFHGSYADMKRFASLVVVSAVDAILLDLGFSSLQMDDPERGFSFQASGPLDMRFDQSTGQTAADLVNTLDPDQLADIFYRYADERNSRRIARAIAREREQEPITTTDRLASIVETALGGRRGARTHPATRVFQALRIAVNGELQELERGLRAGLDLLKPGGRFVVISFHSIEDRIVKEFFATEQRGCICPPEIPVCVCGRKPTLRIIGRAVKPSPSEVATNPRARSAIVRIAERLP